MKYKPYDRHNILEISNAVNVSNISSTLWFDRTNDDIEIQDIIEIREGIIERCLATQFNEDNGRYHTQYAPPLDYINTWTNVKTYSLESDGFETDENLIYYESIPAANVVSNAYSAVYSTVQSVEAGNYTTYSYNSQVYKNNPPRTPHASREYNYNERYILGQYDQFVVSGFTGDYEDLNDTYVFYALVNGTYTYKGAGLNHITYTHLETTFSDYVNNFVKPFAPWITVTGLEQNPTVTKGDLMFKTPLTPPDEPTISDYIIQDAPLITTTPVTNFPIRNRIGTYTEEIGFIDKTLVGDILIGEKDNEGYYVAFRSMFYGPFVYPSMTPISDFFGGTSDYTKYGFYIAQSKWNVDTYSNTRSDLLIVPTSFWDSIALDGDVVSTVVMSNSNPIGTAYGFGDNKLDVVEDESITIAQNSHSITKTMLTQRRKALSWFDTILLGATGVDLVRTVKWDVNEEDNGRIASGYGPTFLQAKDDAITNETTFVSNTAPYAYNLAIKIADDNFYFEYGSVKNRIRCDYIYPELKCDVSYYAYSNVKSGLTSSSNNYSLFNSFDVAMVQDKFVIVENDGAEAYRSSCMSGTIDADPLFELCVEPANIGDRQAKSFQALDMDVMAKFTMEHCVI